MRKGKTRAIDRHANRRSNDENLTREEKEGPHKARQLGALLRIEYKCLNKLVVPRGVLPLLTVKGRDKPEY